MRKLVKDIDEQTKVCGIVFDGTDNEWALSEGYTAKDVEQGYDGNWYLIGHAPEKPVPTREEIDEARISYRHYHIDDRTLARQRKQANGTWSEDDERAYIELDTQVTAWIEENLPYPDEEE